MVSFETVIQYLHLFDSKQVQKTLNTASSRRLQSEVKPEAEKISYPYRPRSSSNTSQSVLIEEHRRLIEPYRGYVGEVGIRSLLAVRVETKICPFLWYYCSDICADNNLCWEGEWSAIIVCREEKWLLNKADL